MPEAQALKRPAERGIFEVMAVKDEFDALLPAVLQTCECVYGERLVSVAVFGSVGRGTPRADSDLDFLVVAEPLPRGRVRRAEEFDRANALLKPALLRARAGGVSTRMAPVFKTRQEVARGSALFIDMTEDARILCDRGAFFQNYLDGFRARLTRLGSRRIWRGDAWYWDLKPDYRPGEIFEI